MEKSKKLLNVFFCLFCFLFWTKTKHKNPSSHVYNIYTRAGLEQHLHPARIRMWEHSSHRNMQTGCRYTTTGYCQFGGGRGRRCLDKNRWNQWKWEGFLKNGKNLEGRKDTPVLVNRAISILKVWHVISSLSSSPTHTHKLYSDMIAVLMPLLQHFRCKLKIASSLLSNLSQDWVNHYEKNSSFLNITLFLF